MPVHRLLEALRRREVLAALATVALGVIAVVALLGPAVGDAEATSTTVSSDAPAPREPAPRFAAPTIEGSTFKLAAATGSPVWVNVWASWRPPRRAEFPDIDEVRREGAGHGLVFVAMNFGEDLDSIRSYPRNTGYDFTVGLDVFGEFANADRVLGLPMHVFIAADGTLDSLRVGGMTRAEMDAKVAELTAESRGAAAGAAEDAGS